MVKNGMEEETGPRMVKINYKTKRKEHRKYKKPIKGMFENFSMRELRALARGRKVKLNKIDPNDKKKRMLKTKTELKTDLAQKMKL